MNRAIVLTLLFVVGCFLPFKAHASALPDQSVYSGSVTAADGSVIPVSIFIGYNDDDTTADDDEVILYKKSMRAGFTIDSEGGPYNFTTVKVDLDTGTVDLRYVRPSASTSGVPSLRFLGKIQKDGSIAGDVISGIRGELGQFSVAEQKGLIKLLTQDKYVGQYKGTMTLATTGKATPISFDLESNGSSSTNPSTLETDFTPGRSGGALLSADYRMPFASIVIDYFFHKIWLTGIVVGSTQSYVTFQGTINGDTISGNVLGSNNSTAGTFSVQRGTK